MIEEVGFEFGEVGVALVHFGDGGLGVNAGGVGVCTRVLGPLRVAGHIVLQCHELGATLLAVPERIAVLVACTTCTGG